uniref:Uncharacterized protein n=1 Tax=Macaca nemestrina TaxID=9545 RepID=A0A2K6BZI9_MACNE
MSSWPTRPTKSTAPPRPGGKNGKVCLCFLNTMFCKSVVF